MSERVVDSETSFAKIACGGVLGVNGTLRHTPTTDRATLPSIAAAIYCLRRRRERLFATGLFSEPAWDLLLDLFAAETTRKRVSITSACIASVAPTTTALRCIKQLESENLIYRERDPMDARRSYIRLSTHSIGALEGLLNGFSIAIGR